jgi:muramidase (phage lysozyme)
MDTYDPLLQFIGQHESRNDPNAIWGGIKRADYPDKPLTAMTVGAVLAWQDSIDFKYMSEASGQWQIMEDTLRDLVKQGHAKLTDMYDYNTQRKLAVALLKRRGLNEYMAGVYTAEKFANLVAREWASMPLVSGPNIGKSYYAGDGLNKSGTSHTAFLAAVKAIRPAGAAASAPYVPGGVTELPLKPVGLAALFAAITAIFAGFKS